MLHRCALYTDGYCCTRSLRTQANTAQLILQAFVIGSLLVRWFRDRNKGRKPKKPRTPPSGDS